MFFVYQQLVLVWLLLQVSWGEGFSPLSFFQKLSAPKPPEKEPRPRAPAIERVEGEPILVVNEPRYNCRVHLVGVSHGERTSAKLVESTIKSIRPSAVVLELCKDRYLAMSVESSVVPTTNTSMIQEYRERRERLEAYREKNPSKLSQSLGLMKNNVNFIKSQGIVAGSFLSASVLLSVSQRLFGVVKKEDEEEFVTAMKAAQKLKIPIRLGDAPQEETLRSLNGLLHPDTLNPIAILLALSCFLFSAFGIESPYLPWKLNPNKSKEKKNLYLKSLDSPSTPPEGEKKVGWINIVDIYRQKKEMIPSLVPVVGLMIFSILISSIPDLGIAQPDPLSTSGISALSDWFSPERLIPLSLIESNTYLLSLWENIFKKLNSESTADLMSSLNYGIMNALSFFITIRVAKIIGVDRDRFIARKVQEFCKEYPGAELVVVIGMLHVNGVASWLAEGDVPATENEFLPWA